MIYMIVMKVKGNRFFETRRLTSRKLNVRRRKLKNIILFVSILVLLVGCSDNKEVSQQKNEETAEVFETSGPTQPTQEELNEEMKSDAVQANFVELNVDDPPNGKRIFAEGEVSILTKDVLDEFILTTTEGDGYGMYKVILANTTDNEYNEGDIVRIYGAVNGKDEDGIPKITATILEMVE